MTTKYLDANGLSHFWDKVKGLVANKQDTLVSGTNIKTINNTSLLGSGNITVGGGGTVPDPLTIADLNVTNEASINKIIVPNATGAYHEIWSDTSGTHVIEIYDSNEDPLWRLYFSSSGNLARQQWNGSAWGTAEYLHFGTLGIANGGTGQTNANAAARALGMAKTAGDSVTLSGYVANGYLSNAKKSAYVLINLPYSIYGVTSANCTYSGTFTARQNNLYLFGSTASTPRNLSAVTTSIVVNANGWIRMAITGSEQTNAINNNPISIYFDSLTINFKA